MKKYFIESLLIVGSVLFSLYIDSLIQHQNKIDLKKSILSELRLTINQDLNQLKNVVDVEGSTLVSNQILLDDYLSKTKLNKKELVKHFSNLKQFGALSFFIQSGPYSQLIQTGSLELINNKSLRSNLLLAYDNLNKRKEFGDIMLDQFSLDFGRELSPYVVVSESISDSINKFYKTRKVDNFVVSDDYYNSPKVFFFYSEYKFWIEAFIDIHKNYSELLNKILVQIESELND